MFRGVYKARLDEKGRLKLPADFMREIDKCRDAGFFVTSLDGRAIEIYPIAEWEKIEQKFAEASVVDVTARKFLAAHSYYGERVEMDAQGRLLLPERLRESARIVDEVVIFGKLSMLSVAGRDQFERDLQVASPLSPEDQVQLAGILKKS
jgi:MraZ protein